MSAAVQPITPAALSNVSAGIKLSEIREAIPQLEAAYNAKVEVAEAFGDLCKLVAQRAGISPSLLGMYIAAVCNDTIERKQAQMEQLSLLFEELR